MYIQICPKYLHQTKNGKGKPPQWKRLAFHFRSLLLFALGNLRLICRMPGDPLRLPLLILFTNRLADSDVLRRVPTLEDCTLRGI